MTLRQTVLTAMLCLGFSGNAALAQLANAPTTAGMVKRVAGLVLVERSGTSQLLAIGSPVREGDTIRTGSDGAVGITLADDTLLAVGPDSELVLSEFAFNSTTQDGNMLASLWRGTLSVVTGLIGRKTPENVRVQTRTVVLGVRGTEFIVDTKGVQK